ncbi:MAG: cytochrome P450, partial [Anaerolineales bacterium]
MTTPPLVSGSLPVIGHLLEMLKDRETLFRRGHQEHGQIFTINLAGQKTVVLGGAEHNRIFFTETDKSLNIDEGFEYLRAAVGEVLLTAPKEMYYNQKPVLMAVFRREQMSRYIHAMNVEVQKWLDGLGNEGQFDIVAEMLHLTQYVAAHAFLGENHASELNGKFWASYAHIARSLDPVLPPNLPLPKFIQRDKAKKYIQSIFSAMIAKRRQHPDQYDDLITIVQSTPQKDGTYMDDETIVSLFTGLLLAGHETTAGQAAWSVIQLLQHPEHLDEVRKNIKQLVAPNSEISPHDLRNLEYVYWAIDETTRLRPSASTQLRLVKQPLEIGEYTIPAGTRLMTSDAITNLDEVTFHNPESYDPRRFSPERNEASNPFSVIGFGGGIHTCTGMNFAKNEMAVIIAKIFGQFDLELITKEPTVLV